MICRHVQDPVKSWKRELRQRERKKTLLSSQGLQDFVNEPRHAPRIRIFTCSSGVTASKLARKLYDTLQRAITESESTFELDAEKPLNSFQIANVTSADVILIIASTTGSGEIPSNASKFIRRYASTQALSKAPRFSVFANGDSTFGDTYNAAAERVQKIMIAMSCRPLLGYCFAGDTACGNPDWTSFNQWFDTIGQLIFGNLRKVDLPVNLKNVDEKTTALRELPLATLVKKYRPHPNGMVLATFDIGNLEYHEMDHLKFLAPNPRSEVYRALRILGLAEDAVFKWHHQKAFDFLCRFVDLARPFRTLDWYPGFENLADHARADLKKLTVCDLLKTVESPWPEKMIENACKDMGSIQPRLYSVASCQRYQNNHLENTHKQSGGNLVDVLVKVNDMGKFSNTWLLQAPISAKIRFGQASPDTWRVVSTQRPDAPLIAIATGSGMGPIRSILQRRMCELGRTQRSTATAHSLEVIEASLTKHSPHGSGMASSSTPYEKPTEASRDAPFDASDMLASIHLFAGFKREDETLVDYLIRPAMKAGMFGTLELVRSNPDRSRVQDRLRVNRRKLAMLLKDPGCIVFVCANESAADAAEKSLDEIAGTIIRKLLGERYIEEVFRSHTGGAE